MKKDPNCNGLDELGYCEYWCGELTASQRNVLEYRKEQGAFIGVGRAIGSSTYMPLILIGTSANVIDRVGYLQLSAVVGRRSFEWEVN